MGGPKERMVYFHSQSPSAFSLSDHHPCDITVVCTATSSDVTRQALKLQT